MEANEEIYNNSVCHSENESDEEIVSEKVHMLANKIYQEFENMIKAHGSGVVDGLTPLIVSMLENMDKLYCNKDKITLKLDLMREDQAQLYTQYEREKTLRKLSEEKINKLEDDFEEERQQFEDRIEFLETNNRMADGKLRNHRDLITRLEEKEVDLRKEYGQLQQRYSDLLLKSARIDHNNSNSRQTSTKSDLLSDSSNVNNDFTHTDDIIESQLKDEHFIEKPDDPCETPKNKCHIVEDIDEFAEFETPTLPHSDNNSNETDEECSNDFEGEEIDDLNMEKEIQFLIKENQDLIETKVALNIVKDDLITKLDEMTGEMCIIREDLRNANSLKKEYRIRATECEKKIEELTKQLEVQNKKLRDLDDDNMIECNITCDGQQTKTRFTRSEVARILLERNKFKEELMELQEAVKYHTSMMNNNSRSKSRSIFSIFSNVLSSATAFTAEAIVGSGNEMTVGQMSNSFNGPPNIDITQLKSNLVPGSAVRINTNPLISQFSNAKPSTNVDIVPPNVIERQHDQ